MSYTVNEYYSVYHEIRVIARKEHECDSVLCSEPIRKGDSYWRIQIVFDGGAKTIKRCIRCQHLHVHLRGLGDYETWPDERLNCGLTYEEEWGKVPDHIAALAFWKPGEKLPCQWICTNLKEYVIPTRICYEYYFWRMNKTTRCARDGHCTQPGNYKSACTTAQVWES